MTMNDGVMDTVKGSFKPLRDSVNAPPDSPDHTSAFLWEWFTTKPFRDSGEVRFIGNVESEWLPIAFLGERRHENASPITRIEAIFVSGSRSYIGVWECSERLGIVSATNPAMDCRAQCQTTKIPQS